MLTCFICPYRRIEELIELIEELPSRTSQLVHEVQAILLPPRSFQNLKINLNLKILILNLKILSVPEGGLRERWGKDFHQGLL